MPKLKTLSGKDVVSFFESHNFEITSQKGSHIKIKRIFNGSKQVLIIPNHKELRVGTLNNIYTQSAIYLGKDTVFNFFFNQ